MLLRYNSSSLKALPFEYIHVVYNLLVVEQLDYKVRNFFLKILRTGLSDQPT